MEPSTDPSASPRRGALSTLVMEHPFADDELLLHGSERSVTASTARAEAAALADELVVAGVRPGQGVAVQLPNSPDVVIAMTAIWLAGAVLVPLNHRAPPAEHDRVLASLAPAAVLGATGLETRPDARTFDTETAFILWTSGTTGPPKPILHTHSGYLELLDRVLGPLRGSDSRSTGDWATSAERRRPSPNLIPVSLALNAGIYNSLFGLRAGAELVIMERFEPRQLAELVARFSIRSTVLPPAAMVALTDDDAVTDLAPLRYVRSITAPLSPFQARRFATKFGVRILNSYGQAEIGEVIGWTAADAKEHPEKVGAAGRPLPGVSIRIVEEDGAEAPAGVVGPLHVRPPSMAAGYATGASLDERVDERGYLVTGDLARIDDDGFVWVEGRASDLINRGGNKVYPEEVEEVLDLVPAVVEAAVVGASDERLGQVPVAYVVLGEPVDDAELEAVCREHLTPYKVPVAFHRVEALPRTQAGKLQRRALAEAHELSLPGPSGGSERLGT